MAPRHGRSDYQLVGLQIISRYLLISTQVPRLPATLAAPISHASRRTATSPGCGRGWRSRLNSVHFGKKVLLHNIYIYNIYRIYRIIITQYLQYLQNLQCAGGGGHGSPGEPLAAALPGQGAARAGGRMTNTQPNCHVKL